MSAPFPKPTGQVLQSLAFWNKIQLAYSERRQAIGQAAVDPFVLDGYWQDLTMYQGWQNWIETNCTTFIDHVNGPLSDDKLSFRYWTSATFREAANLHPDGFSRYDMDGTLIGHGIAQEDDAILANTVKEIQQAFSMLRYTIATPYGCAMRGVDAGGSGGYSTWEAAKSAQESQWYAGSPTLIDYPGYVYRYSRTQGIAGEAPGYFFAYIFSTETKIEIRNVPYHVNRSCKVYALSEKMRPAQQPDPVKAVFADLGFPEVEENKLSLCGTCQSTSDEIMFTDWLGLAYPDFPDWCQEPDRTSLYSSYGYQQVALVADTGAVIGWDFTNINQ